MLTTNLLGEEFTSLEEGKREGGATKNFSQSVYSATYGLLITLD